MNRPLRSIALALFALEYSFWIVLRTSVPLNRWSCFWCLPFAFAFVFVFDLELFLVLFHLSFLHSSTFDPVLAFIMFFFLSKLFHLYFQHERFEVRYSVGFRNGQGERGLECSVPKKFMRVELSMLTSLIVFNLLGMME